MDYEELIAKKYNELQAMAKKAGIKANMKAQRLIQALIKQNSQEGEMVDSSSQDLPQPNHSNIKEDEINSLDSEGAKNSDESSKKLEIHEMNSDEWETSVVISNDLKVSEISSPKKKTEPDGLVQSPTNKKQRRGTYELDNSILGSTLPDDQHPCEADALKEPQLVGLDKPETKSQNKMPEASLASAKKSRVQYLTKNTPKENRISNGVPKVGKNTISKAKTPNFARIHQKQFDKMESLTDYYKKKQRLFSCASSKKKEEEQERNLVTSSNTKPPKKALFSSSQFSSRKSSTTKTPLKTVAKTQSYQPSSKLKLPVIKLNKLLVEKNSSNIFANGVKITRDAKTPTVKFEVAKKSNIPLRERHQKIRRPTESKPESRLQKQREYIKGVRTNKRFELQMKLRLEK